MKPIYHTQVQLRHRKLKQIERAVQNEQNDIKKSKLMTSEGISRAYRKRKKEQARVQRDCVIIHGSVVHKRGKNTSDKSRPIYTFHVIEQKNTEYSKENWLQPSDDLQFPSVFSLKSK